MFNEEELKKSKRKSFRRTYSNINGRHPREDRRNLKRGKTKKNIRNRTAVGYSASTFARVTSNDCIIDTIRVK